jgi:hypothetical protein
LLGRLYSPDDSAPQVRRLVPTQAATRTAWRRRLRSRRRATTVTASLPANTGNILEDNLAQAISGVMTFGTGDLVINGGTATAGVATVNSSGVVSSATLSSQIDSVFGSSQGSILYRGVSVWTALAPGSSGFFLQTQGASANPTWAAASGGTGCNTGGSAGDLLTANGAGGCTTVTVSTLTNGALALGSSGTAGSVAMGNATSGTVTLQPVSGALGSVTASLPANNGTILENNLAQTISAAMSFNSGDLVLNGSVSGTTTLNAASAAGSTTATLPANTGTIVESNLATTISAAFTFNANDLICCGGSTTAGPAVASAAGIITSEQFITNAQGGTGISTSASTGVAQVSAGTWSVSTALANGTTATTQAGGDSSTKVATDAFVASALPSLPLSVSNGGTGSSTGLPVANGSIYGQANGSAYIASGLTFTWPTAALLSCTVRAGGTGYSGAPTVNILGGITNGGSSGGASATATISGGAVNSCSTSGGGFSFPPTAYLTGGGGSGAQIVFTLHTTESFTTAAGTIIINGASVSVPSYTHTYSVSSGTTASYCDFINVSSGAYTTQLAAAGNSFCLSAPANNVLLRIVYVGNGQYECWNCTLGVNDNGLGFQDGLISVQYYIPTVAAYSYYQTNTRDWPPSETRLIAPAASGTNAFSAQNFACMQGSFNSRQGQCQWSGQYFVFMSPDQEPAPFTNFLDAGPLIVLARCKAAGEDCGNGRNGVSGDLLSGIITEGASASGTAFYTETLTRVSNAATPAGEYHIMTSQSDGFSSRFVFGGGLYATPSVNGINSPGQCGQITVPSGSPVQTVDTGPSTINLCGSATNASGNSTGYYLNNLLALNMSSSDFVELHSIDAGHSLDNYLCYASASDAHIGNNTTCGSSTIRFKNPLGEINESAALNAIKALPDTVHVWKFKPEHGDPDVEHIGLYAEDVEKMDHRCAIYEYGKIKNYEERCVIDYLVVAMKAQQQEIDYLAVTMKAQQREIDGLHRYLPRHD